MCAKCLGITAADIDGAPLKRRRRYGFALNREDYVDHLRPMLSAALWEFFHTQIIQLADPSTLTSYGATKLSAALQCRFRASSAWHPPMVGSAELTLSKRRLA